MKKMFVLVIIFINWFYLLFITQINELPFSIFIWISHFHKIPEK